MSFNIEWGGTHVRFASVIEAIRAADAEVVGIQEAEGNLERLADDLGWYFNRRNHVISKYPVLDPPNGKGHFVFVEIRPGRVIAFANVHLPSDPYGIYWLRQGRALAEVLVLEREVRLPKVVPVLRALTSVHRREIPVFLTGDFNSPSHADWTSAAVGEYPYRDFPFAWPVSLAVADSGLHDSYRTVHPDAATHPGFTWWAARPRIEDYNPSDETDQSRIDFVWYGGPVEVIDSRIVGETGARDVSIAVSPWPSDHRAVVSQFEVRPAHLPVLIATEQRVHESGDNVQVVYRNPPSTHGSIALLRRTGWNATELERRIRTDPGIGRAEVTGLPAGTYKIALLDGDGNAISSNELWVLAPDAEPTLEIAGQKFAAGEALPITWSNAPGNRFDWIAIFDAAAAKDSQAYIAYAYVGARSSGRMLVDSRTAAYGWPLPPGRYVARLLEDDGFDLLDQSAPFVVE